MQMSEKDYLEKTKIYGDSGLEVLSYEDFLILDDSERETYLEDLETNLLKIKNQENQENKTFELKPIDDKGIQELKKLFIDLIKNLSLENKTSSEKINDSSDKAVIENNTENNENSEDKNFIYSLTRNMKEPKLPIALENKVLDILKNASVTKQVFKYSFQGQIKESSLKNQIKDLLVSLPVRKDFSLDEIAKVSYGISINSKEMKDFEGADPESVITHKKVENYALKNNLSIKTEHDYLNVLNIVEAKGI